ncbi:TPM domain-containing protein [uncultured Pseudokineococcus sp.]|uniref:TPM domain-containing protein n=1 Tax=uncultured Pseudokineococcus sp. TaxID=1642928 RepID=UPI00261D1D53|nr:TPM domain-containing protein [uncultured Pseudokineococcus sp.]
MSVRGVAAPRSAAAVVLGVLLAVLAPLLLVVGAPPASAVAPLRLDEQVTDQVGALAGDEQQVEQALADLRAETGVQLFVVFVDSFDGLGGQEWAQQTGDLSQLGDGDGVLAVATGDRAYGSVVDADVDAPAANAAAESRLAQDDWAGAVEAYADVLASSAGGSDGSGAGGGAGSDGGSGGVSGLAVLVVLLLVGVAVAVVVALVRGRREQRSDRARRRAAAPAPAPVEPLPDLERRAGSALVAVDDAVMASADEVEFARAEFGDEAVVPFERALAGAREDLAAAFAARRRADGEGEAGDRVEVDEAGRRAALAEVLERCGRADAALDEQAGAFDALRDLGRRAGAVLDARADDVAALRPRVAQEHERLAALHRAYADAAVAAVRTAPDDAGASLDLAEDEVEEGRAAVDAGDTGRAALAARAADQATTRARRLLDAVGARERELEEAERHLADARAETEQDLAEAQALLGVGGDARELAPLLARARAAVAEAEAAQQPGRQDPLTALRRLEEADEALDTALASVRERRARAQRARSGLDHALVAARAEVAAARDVVAVRRGGVGQEARTLLRDAERALDRAERAADDDPVTALAEARRADALAERAQRSAHDDLDRRGPFDGGGYGGRRGSSVEAAVLGGILGAVLTGGGHRGGGGGFGGGGFGGGGGGFGGGGFGGSGGGGGFGGGGFGGSGGGGRF